MGIYSHGNKGHSHSHTGDSHLSGPEWLDRRRWVRRDQWAFLYDFILFAHYLQRVIQRKVKSSQFHSRRTCSHTPSLDTSSRHQFSDVSLFLCVCLASSACLPISIVLARRVYSADGSQANRSPQRQVDRDVDQTEKIHGGELTDRDTIPSHSHSQLCHQLPFPRNSHSHNYL